MDDAERRARELLAAEFDEPGAYAGTAIDIRRGSFVGIPAERAVSALTKLLRATPPAVGGWHDISTAPKPDDDAPEILLLDGEGRRFVAEWDGAAGHWQGVHAFDGVERVSYFQEWPGRIYNAVAWQPLPPTDHLLQERGE